MYRNGEGVPQDDGEAVTWYRKAAEQGNADAQTNLGFMYATGRGVPQDYSEAVALYRKAAEYGDAQAQFNLAVSYNDGHGVPQDFVEAHMWVNLSAARFTDAKRRETAVELRDLLAEQMTSEDLSEAQRRAREWHAAHQ